MATEPDALHQLARVAGDIRVRGWHPQHDALKRELRVGIAPERRELYDLFARPTSDPAPDDDACAEVATALADAVRRFIETHDGLLLANHGALTVADELLAAYYKMETLEHFARISLVARLLGRERLLSREEVARLQDLRDMYGITAPAPICTDGAEDVTCQVLQAPSSPGSPLVNDGRSVVERKDVLGKDGELRLTYRELTALIEDAVRHLQR